MKMVDPMIMELEQEAKTTRRLLERVPADKLSWRPHAKSRTLGQLAMHVATTPGALAELSHLDVFMFENSPADVDPKGQKDLLDAHDAGLAKAKQHLGRMDDAKAMGMWKGTVAVRPSSSRRGSDCSAPSC
jgi:uncharacterized damage-inducible protein DinB